MVLSYWINLSTESLELLKGISRPTFFRSAWSFHVHIFYQFSFTNCLRNLGHLSFLLPWNPEGKDLQIFSYPMSFFFFFPVFCCTSEFSKQHVHFFQRQENFLDVTGKRKLRKAIIIASLCPCACGFFRICSEFQNLQVFPTLWSFLGFKAMNFLCKKLAFCVKEHCVMTKGKHRTGKLQMGKFHTGAYPTYGMHFKIWSCTCFWNIYL